MSWNQKLQIFYDAEFTGLHRDTSFISIGMLSNSGSTFYAEFTDYDENQVDDWLKEHVIDNLILGDLIPIVDGGVRKTKNNNIAVDTENTSYDVMMKGDRHVVTFHLLSWLRHESVLNGNKQIQFFTDCYAYDWMLLNTLIGVDGKALNIPDFIYYIPVDLSTILYYAGIDPDINREEFIGEFALETLKRISPFDKMENFKHNSLWDVYVAAYCYAKIIQKEIIPGELNLLIMTK